MVSRPVPDHIADAMGRAWARFAALRGREMAECFIALNRRTRLPEIAVVWPHEPMLYPAQPREWICNGTRETLLSDALEDLQDAWLKWVSTHG